MDKKRLIAWIFVIILISSNNIVFCAEAEQNIIQPASKQLKGSVTDYREEYINKGWWEKFNDPILNGYIYKASAENQDLKIATLRVLQAQAIVEQYFGKELPSIGVGTSFTRQKTSDNVEMGNFKLPAYTENSYMFPLSVNYELDLWRKNREKTIAASKDLESIKYDEKAAYISLTSAVAAAYFNAIKTDKILDIQKDIINLRKEIADLTKEKNINGLCSTAEVIRAEKALTEAQSALNDLEKYRSIFLNQLAVLTGQSVDDSLSLKRASIDDIDLISDLPSSIQSNVVLERPDILKAEAQLQKSRIDVSLARKDFLPNISLTGQFGFNATSLSKVFDWNSYITSIGVNIFESIFTGGQRKARLKEKKYRYQEMLENYQKTILQSFQEVNNSLVALKTDGQKDKDNISRINLEKKNLELINARYEEGIISYLDTLEYKEKLETLKKDRIQSKVDCLIDSLSLYKAVGGKI